MSKVDEFLTKEAKRLRNEADRLERKHGVGGQYAEYIALNRSHAAGMEADVRGPTRDLSRYDPIANEPDNGDRFW